MPFDWPLARTELLFIGSGPGIAFLASSVAAMAHGTRGDSRRSSYWLGFALGTSIPLTAALILYGVAQWLDRHLEWVVPYLIGVAVLMLGWWLLRHTKRLDWLTLLEWRRWTVVPESAGKGFDMGKHAALFWWGLVVSPVIMYSVVIK